jgi:hypothetical protein
MFPFSNFITFELNGAFQPMDRSDFYLARNINFNMVPEKLFTQTQLTLYNSQVSEGLFFPKCKILKLVECGDLTGINFARCASLRRLELTYSQVPDNSWLLTVRECPGLKTLLIRVP